MMVTQPEVDETSGLALIPTFEMDHTHPAGVVAVAIEPGRRLAVRWRSPAGAEALRQFRGHPGRLALLGPYAFVVDVRGRSGKGLLYGIRVADGEVMSRTVLDGPGQRYAKPLIVGDRLYLTSCEDDRGPSNLQGYRVP
jgi:hypothetical protein